MANVTSLESGSQAESSLFSQFNPSQMTSKEFLKLKKKEQKQKIKKFWSGANDKALLSLMEAHGENWAAISQAFNFPFVTPKEVKDRFKNKLNPNLKRGRFSLEEDKIICQVYETFGPKWKEAIKILRNRTENMVKNRFYSYLKKKYFPKGT